MRGEYYLGQVELEVELPATHSLGYIPVLIEERQANLDDLQEVDITSEDKFVSKL